MSDPQPQPSPEPAARPEAQPQARPRAEAQAGGSGYDDRRRGEAYFPLPQAEAPAAKSRGWLKAVAAACVVALCAGGMLSRRERRGVVHPVAPAIGDSVNRLLGLLVLSPADRDGAATDAAVRVLKSEDRDAQLAAGARRLEEQRAASPERLAALLAARTPEQRAAEALAASPEALREKVAQGRAGFYTWRVAAADEGGDVVELSVDGVPTARAITSREGAVVQVPLDPSAVHEFRTTLVFERDRRVYVKDGPAQAAPVAARTSLGLASSAGQSASRTLAAGESASWTVQMGGGASLGSGQ